MNSDKTKMLKTFIDSNQMPELTLDNLLKIVGSYSYDSDKTKCIQFLQNARRLTLTRRDVIQLARGYDYDSDRMKFMNIFLGNILTVTRETLPEVVGLLTDDSYKNKFLVAYVTYCSIYENGKYYLDVDYLMPILRTYTYESHILKLMPNLLAKATLKPISFDTMMVFVNLFTYTSDHIKMFRIILPYTSLSSRGELTHEQFKQIMGLTEYASDKIKLIQCLGRAVPQFNGDQWLDLVKSVSYSDDRIKLTDCLTQYVTITPNLDKSEEFAKTLSTLFNSIEDWDSIMNRFDLNQTLVAKYRPTKTRAELKKERMDELIKSGAVTVSNGGTTIRYNAGSSTNRTVTFDGNGSITITGDSINSIGDITEIMKIFK